MMIANRYHRLQFAAIFMLISACSTKQFVAPVIEGSNGARLSRYDLVSFSPDETSNFIVSYRLGDQIKALFFKNFIAGGTRVGASLVPVNSYSYESLNFQYQGGLDSVLSSNQDQTRYRYFYSASRLDSVTFTTQIDTGKFTFQYTASGMLASYLYEDKIVQKPKVKTFYELLYGSLSSDPYRINQYLIDNGGKRLLTYVTDLSFDQHPNAFLGLPVLRNFDLNAQGKGFPSGLVALFASHNVSASLRRKLFFQSGEGGSSAAEADTIPILRSTRFYRYNSQGLPTTCNEQYEDFSRNVKGFYNFSYSY